MKVSRTLMKQVRALLEERLDYYSQFNPSPLSVKQFADFGRAADVASSYLFLRQELPVRLANIMKEFRLLPDHLTSRHSLIAVKDLYRQSFEELLQYETRVDTNTFTDTLVRIRDRHVDVVMQTAAAVMDMTETQDIDSNAEANVQYFLDRFYMSRISIRMLINQHTLLFGPQSSQGRHIGCIDPECDIQRVIVDAYENARFLCDGYYMNSPKLDLTPHNTPEGRPLTLPYVPSHLYHMLFEVFKNAMRAVVEHHGADSLELPPLSVLVVRGEEDLCIKVSDQGGGIPRSQMDLLFNYMYSTAPKLGGAADSTSPPLAGYGYGLPLSRLYARYFQGDLTVSSAEGYGTDACIYLKAISSEANELLPIYNKTTQRQYSTPHNTHDWSTQLHHNMTIRPFSTMYHNRVNGNHAWRTTLNNSSASVDLHRQS